MKHLGKHQKEVAGGVQASFVMRSVASSEKPKLENVTDRLPPANASNESLSRKIPDITCVATLSQMRRANKCANLCRNSLMQGRPAKCTGSCLFHFPWIDMLGQAD